MEAAKKMGPDMNIIIFELTLPRRNIIIEEDQDNLKKHVEAFSWVRSENAFIATDLARQNTTSISLVSPSSSFAR